MNRAVPYFSNNNIIPNYLGLLIILPENLNFNLFIFYYIYYIKDKY